MDVPSEEAPLTVGIEVRFLNAITTLPSLVVVLSDGSPEIHTVTGTVTPYRPFTGRDIQVALIRSRDSASAARAESTAARARNSTSLTPNDSGAMGRTENAPDTLAVRREMLSGGGRYTIIGMPSDDGAGVTLRIVADSILPDTNVAQVRLIHAAALAGQFDLLLVGTKSAVFEGVSFANATSFQRLAPSASQRLALRQESRPDHPTTIPLIQRLDAGKAYTIVVAGNRDSWEAVLIRDDIASALASRVHASLIDSAPAKAGRR
ncbi:MAG: DUF4397 domain-containing protein [Gemmatimonadaceae bacterium]